MFDETGDDGVRRIGKLISLDDFMNVPEEIGGRVGVIPWFVATVVGEDGQRRATPMVKLCVTNHLYLSDVGGGFRKIHTPYHGLLKELEEEVPTWKEEIVRQLQHPSTFILALEQCAVRSNVPNPIPIQFLIFPHVSIQRLDQAPFQPTDEVRAIMTRTLGQFHDIVDHRPTIASSGIRMYHLFRRHDVLGQAIEQLFSGGVQKVEYQEADLVDENVEVLLTNGIHTATFQELVRNNSNFSRNQQNVWPMRQAYAHEQMTRWMKNSRSNGVKSSNGVKKRNSNHWRTINQKRYNTNRGNTHQKNHRKGENTRRMRRGIVSL